MHFFRNSPFSVCISGAAKRKFGKLLPMVDLGCVQMPSIWVLALSCLSYTVGQKMTKFLPTTTTGRCTLKLLHVVDLKLVVLLLEYLIFEHFRVLLKQQGVPKSVGVLHIFELSRSNAVGYCNSKTNLFST